MTTRSSALILLAVLLAGSDSYAQSLNCSFTFDPPSARFSAEAVPGATVRMTKREAAMTPVPCPSFRFQIAEDWLEITDGQADPVQFVGGQVVSRFTLTYALTANPGGPRTAVVNVMARAAPDSPTEVNRGMFQVVQEGEGVEPPPVPDGDPMLSINRSGFVFLAQGGTTSAQLLELVNTGGNDAPWSVSASTRSGGDWLAVDPPAGTVTAARESSIVRVTVNSTGLDPGDYYGTVQVRGPGSPQSATVVMRVLADQEFVPAAIEPEGFLFVGRSVGATQQQMALTNPGSRPLMVEATARFDDGVQPWFAVDPVGGALAPGETRMVEIRPTADATPGVFRGEIEVLSRGGGETATRRIATALVSIADGLALRPQQAGCVPTQLVPVWRRPALDFSVVAGFPTAVETQVVDDCGEPLMTGSVRAEFSNGDPQLALSPLRDGRWVATWAPTRVDGALTATVRASTDSTPPIEATVMVSGSIPEAAVVPIIGAAPVSAVSFARDDAIGIGAFAALFGTELAGGLTAADSLPLPGALGGTSVLIDGEEMPLLFTSPGQVNGVIPLDLAPGAHSMLVLRGDTISTPLRIQVTGPQPALFSRDATGSGQGLIERVSPDGGRSIAEPGTPARPGDVLVIYASGLGAVTGEVVAGQASPVSPLAQTVEPVTVTVGGRAAAVAFAGLTPGFAGLFQVNATLPTDAPAGDAIPVVASVGVAASQVVTIAVAGS